MIPNGLPKLSYAEAPAIVMTKPGHCAGLLFEVTTKAVMEAVRKIAGTSAPLATLADVKREVEQMMQASQQIAGFMQAMRGE